MQVNDVGVEYSSLVVGRPRRMRAPATTPTLSRGKIAVLNVSIVTLCGSGLESLVYCKSIDDSAELRGVPIDHHRRSTAEHPRKWAAPSTWAGMAKRMVNVHNLPAADRSEALGR
jgi:hypothetical protein